VEKYIDEGTNRYLNLFFFFYKLKMRMYAKIEFKKLTGCVGKNSSIMKLLTF
jgi:hypothetical protein